MLSVCREQPPGTDDGRLMKNKMAILMRKERKGQHPVPEGGGILAKTSVDGEKREEPFVIPHNYTDRGGVMEFFKPRMLAEGGGAGAVVALLLIALVLPLRLPVIVSAFLIGGPTLAVMALGCFGYHDEPWSAAIRYSIAHRQNARKMAYRLKIKGGGENDGKHKK